MKKGKINIVISDTHCGSDRAVFPPSITLPPLMADDNERTLKYSLNQKKLFDHLMFCADYVKEFFTDYEKVFIHNGDAIEGIHHRTIQLSAPMVEDHVLIHIEVMEEFLSRAGFSVGNGDELKYVSGTEVHTGWAESGIAKHFEPYGATFHDELKMNQHGKNIWLVHQWKGVGDGANEGNGIASGLRNMYFNALGEGKIMPDVVIASHYHKAAMSSYTQKWRTYYGMITPSFQMKTRFGQKVSAFQRNDIGIGLVEVSTGGAILIHKPLLMD